MPSRTPKRDVSLLWPICSQCGNRHRGTAGCPRSRVWLVAATCRKCTRTRYCTSHDAHVR